MTEPFELQVARGQIPGHSQVNIFGYQPLVETTSICIWENPIAYVAPTSAVVMTLVSTSALDASAMRVLVRGVAADYSYLQEIVTMNGVTPVNTTNAFLAINNLIIISSNVAKAANAGVITAKNGGITYGQINVGIGQSQMSQYTVPLGFSYYLTRVNSFAQQNGGTNNYNTYDVEATTPNITYSVLQSPYFQSYDAVRVVPFKYAEKTSVQWRSRTETNTSSVGMVVEGILVKEEGPL
tara:strand:+ start:1117 stop:1833 length:717 start_codon:yes stop_codon:yes gene_type:complete